MPQNAGYLTGPLKLFYLDDDQGVTCPYHYHEFGKIMLFLQGQVTYDIEGKSYHLQPYDIVIIPAGILHRPHAEAGVTYERIIAYISPSYIKEYQQRHCDLSVIFRQAGAAVLRQPQEADNLYSASCRLRQLCCHETDDIYSSALKDTVFLEFLLHLARSVSQGRLTSVKTGREHPKIQQILAYIHAHLTDDLSIETLAHHTYLSPDYLMHIFKAETGYSPGAYITAKRLALARSLMSKKLPLTTVCYDSGFKQYSTFYRAWKKRYGTSPKSGIHPALDRYWEE